MGLAIALTANRRSPIVLMAGNQRRRQRPRAYREHAMNLDNISRRRVLKGTAALTLGTALPLSRAFAKDTTVGFIYVGSRDDYGYNQAHAAGAAALKKMPGIKVVEEEKVPETDAVEKTMESMINLDGATLLFPTSFGYYNPHMIKMALKFPKLRFEHCGGLWTDKDPKNAGSYFGYIDEAQHVAGIVAGSMSKSGKLGFVAAKPIPQVLRNINALTLGAKLANPKITTQVIFTGDWSMPVKEAEATNSLIDQGVDVITCHVDGPKTVVENAARRGAMVTGYHVNQAVLAPKAYLTGAEWNWEVLYPRFVKMFTSGETIPNFYRGGLKEEIVKVSPYGADGSGRRAQEGRRGQGGARLPGHMSSSRDRSSTTRAQPSSPPACPAARPIPSWKRWAIWSRASSERLREGRCRRACLPPKSGVGELLRLPPFGREIRRRGGICRHPRARPGGFARSVRHLCRAVREEPARPLFLYVPGRVRHLVLLAEHADARCSAYPDRAVHRASGATRHGDHRRRGGAADRRAGARRARRWRCKPRRRSFVDVAMACAGMIGGGLVDHAGWCAAPVSRGQ